MKIKNVVCLIAHPDDETIAAGGTLALLAAQASKIHIVSATRGEGGELGSPPVCTRAELPAVREQELRCATHALGATSVTFLDYVDPLIGPDEALSAFEADFDTLVKEIMEVVGSLDASLVFTHGVDGEYGHPAHLLMHNAVRAAVSKLASAPLFYTFGARVPGMQDHLWTQNEPAQLALDVRPWLDSKLAAAQCHATQHALMMRGGQQSTSSVLRDSLRTVEAYFRYLPLLEEGEPPQDDFASLLRAAGAWEPDHQ